jgi:flagellar biosynthesis/type III secretory pathway chaperone
MNGHIEQLNNSLSEKAELLEKLRLLLGEEQHCIRNHDRDGIESIRQIKLLLLDQLAGKTTECRTALESLADELKLPAPVRISSVIAGLAMPLSGHLAAMQQRMLQLVDSVVCSNRRNRDLLYGSLKAVNSSLEFFNGNQGKNCTYGDTGRLSPGIAGGRLVHGEI